MSRFSAKKIKPNCIEVSEILRSLSHPGRLLILGYLTEEPKTVRELQELCEISQSQVSQFLSRMRAEGLVQHSRNGKYITYTLSDGRIQDLIINIQRVFCK